MPAFQIVFATKAELEGAKQTEAQLQRQIGQAKVLGKDYKELEAQLKKVQGAMDGAKVPEAGGIFGKIKEGLGEVIPGFDKIGGLVGKLASGPLGAIAGYFTLIAGGLELAKHSLMEFAQQEKAVFELDASLAQHQLLVDGIREKYQELAEQLQDETAIANEKWLAVLTRLTQFGAKPDQIEDYTEAVKNLAGVIGGDIQTAGELFSKAIAGNFTMLGRYGIHVKEAGTQTEKMNQLMKDLASMGGGQLEARAKSLIGTWGGMKNALADSLKGLGQWIAKLAPVKDTLIVLTDAFSQWAEWLSRTTDKAKGLQNAIATTNVALSDTPEAAQKFAESITKDFETLDKQLDATIARIRLAEELLNKVDDAKFAKAVATLENRLAKGEISPEEFAKQKSKETRELAERKQFRSENSDREEIKASEEAYAEAGAAVNQAAQDIAELKSRIEQRKRFEATQADEINKKEAFNNADAAFTDTQRRARRGEGTQAAVDAREADREQARIAAVVAMSAAAEARAQKPPGDKDSGQMLGELVHLEGALKALTEILTKEKDRYLRGQDLNQQMIAGRKAFETGRETSDIELNTALTEARKKREKVIADYNKDVFEADRTGKPPPQMTPEISQALRAQEDERKRQAADAKARRAVSRPQGDAWEATRDAEVLDTGKNVIAALNQLRRGAMSNFENMAEHLTQFNKALADLEKRLDTIDSQRRYGTRQ